MFKMCLKQHFFANTQKYFWNAGIISWNNFNIWVVILLEFLFFILYSGFYIYQHYYIFFFRSLCFFIVVSILIVVLFFVVVVSIYIMVCLFVWGNIIKPHNEVIPKSAICGFYIWYRKILVSYCTITVKISRE